MSALTAGIFGSWRDVGLRHVVAGFAILTVLIAGADVARAAEPTPSSGSVDMAVTVAKVGKRCFSDLAQVAGVLVARSDVLVRPEREGLQISQVLVEPGESVIVGQVLARLVPPNSQAGAAGGAAIQSPVAGVITASYAVVGALASARAEPLFRIASKGEMELLAEVSSKFFGRIAPDQAAKIEVIGAGELQGKVRLVSTAINPTTQLGEARLSIDNPSRVRIGAFARATITLERRCGLSIPLSALLYGSEGAVVQLVRDNRIEGRRVIVGLLAAGTVEIREGLAEGETVVARAGTFLREGDRVRPLAVNDPAPVQQ